MKKPILALLVVLGFIGILVQSADAQAILARPSEHHGAEVQPASDQLIAIDILLQPDQTMVANANKVNAILRGNLPTGYSLDATHAPHVTLLQRFIRQKDLPAVTAALTKIYAPIRPPR
jgi:hypothetical protein